MNIVALPSGGKLSLVHSASIRRMYVLRFQGALGAIPRMRPDDRSISTRSPFLTWRYGTMTTSPGGTATTMPSVDSGPLNKPATPRRESLAIKGHRDLGGHQRAKLLHKYLPAIEESIDHAVA